MPFVAGYLRVLRRRPGKPDTGLPEGENGETDPDYGIEDGNGAEVQPPIEEVPDPPPGIWPPLTPDHPWRPLPGLPALPGQGLPGAPPMPGQPLPPSGGDGSAGQLPSLPPGTVWPPLPPGVSGNYLALVLIGGGGKGLHYRYVVVDADARPALPIAPGGTPQPK